MTSFDSRMTGKPSIILEAMLPTMGLQLCVPCPLEGCKDFEAACRSVSSSSTCRNTCSADMRSKWSELAEMRIVFSGNSSPRIPLSRFSNRRRAKADFEPESFENTNRSTLPRSRAPRNHRANTSHPGSSWNGLTISAAAR